MFPSSLFAVTASHSNIFTTLGIDWKVLILQIVGFLVLVVILGKFVYPWLMQSVDQRKEQLDYAAKAAEEAKKAAETSERVIAQMLEEARKEAADIVHTARQESVQVIEKAQQKARQSADTIVTEAHEQIEKDITKAQQVLRTETVSLVAAATERVIGSVATTKIDEAFINQIIKETK